LLAARRATGRPRLDEAIYEFPLHEWHDVAGSKLKPLDMIRAFFGLAAILWSYGRRLGPRDRHPARPHLSRPWAVPAESFNRERLRWESPVDARPHSVGEAHPN
jgi:hypothetical protein